jgi:outer membrane protein, heavy metal efflux system
MRIGAYGGLALCLLAGCPSPATSPDMQAVADRTRVPLPKLSAGEVSDAPPEDIKKLLARPLDAEASVRVALLNNRELRADLRSLGIARGQMIQEGVLPNPRVELELQPEQYSSIELRVEYNLTKLLLAPMKSGAAEHSLESARYQAAGAVLLLGYQVRASFAAVQAATQKLTLEKNMLETFAAAHEAALAIAQAGNTATLEVAQQELAYEKNRLLVSQAELTLMRAREALHRVLGVHGADTAYQVSPAFSPLPQGADFASADLEREALRANVDVQSQREELLALGKKTGVARTVGFLPDVEVDLHVLRRTEDRPTTSSADYRFGGGVSVGLPIFDRMQGTRVSLEAQFDAALERYYGSAVRVRSTARELGAHWVSARRRALHIEQKVLPAQRRVVAQTLLQYNAMQLGVFHLLSARQAELETEGMLVDTLAEFWTADAALRALREGKLVTMEPQTAGGTKARSVESSGGH